LLKRTSIYRKMDVPLSVTWYFWIGVVTLAT
jgi:hypothetical protein